jgi:hypothetical protein
MQFISPTGEIHQLEQERTAALALKKTALPKSAAGQAANYTLSFWSMLTAFLKYPELELSTNLAENAMRSIAIGRKNRLHLGSKEAGPKTRRHLLCRRELPTAQHPHPEMRRRSCRSCHLLATRGRAECPEE